MKLSYKKKLPWRQEQQNSFENIKNIISNKVILAYSDFNTGFNIHVDASNTQLGVVISQNKKSIAFFSHKLTTVQQKYMIGK